MINRIIISAFCFTIGAAISVPLEQYKLFWIPLGVMLFFLFDYVFKTAKHLHPVQILCLKFFYALCIGNIIKQITYNPNIEQWGDYIWGGTTFIILLIFIMKWAIQQRRHGKKY